MAVWSSSKAAAHLERDKIRHKRGRESLKGHFFKSSSSEGNRQVNRHFRNRFHWPEWKLYFKTIPTNVVKGCPMLVSVWLRLTNAGIDFSMYKKVTFWHPNKWFLFKNRESLESSALWEGPRHPQKTILQIALFKIQTHHLLLLPDHPSPFS